MPSRPFLTAAALLALTLPAAATEPLPDTKPLTEEGDLAAKMVEGIDKYLMRELAASVEKRKRVLEAGLLLSRSVSRNRSSPTATG